ncbi:MAG: hypothetical protein LBT05_00615 [Planctomycetaceae bacterium]|jgi:hypothetical protein|nr:hypothetical protein [Planctomycetaceae bacterium]
MKEKNEMTPETILNAAIALPPEQRLLVVKKILRSFRKNDFVTIAKKMRPQNNSPSPGNDPYFDNKNNVAEINQRIKEFEQGNAKTIKLEDDKELQEIFSRFR